MATTSLPSLQAFVAEFGLRPIPFFAEADVLNSPIDIYHSFLAERLLALVECDLHLLYNSIQPSKTIEDGDLDIVLPKLKLDGVKPKELAGELLSKFLSDALFKAPFKDGIHIRFFLSTKTLLKLLLPYINDRKATYGKFTPLGLQVQSDSAPQKVIVEFSSPNVAREFTAAHLRGTIIGAFVANIYEAAGCSVLRVNYLGDWGKNLGLLGVGWQKYGSEEAFNQPGHLFRYIHELYIKMEEELQPEQEARKQARADGQDTSVLESQGLFAERDATFKRMEDGEVEEIAFWKKLRDISIEYYTETYARLNIRFDEYSGESQVSLSSEAVTEVESVLKEKDIWEEQNGAWVIDFDKHGGRLGTATIRDRNGSTSYLLRDIATVFDRLKTHAFDKMVYVVCEQDVHFRQVFKVVELMGRADVANKLHHVTFTKPSGPSPHVGSVQLLGDILDRSEKQMHEAIVADPETFPIENTEAVAKMVGINSMVIQELSSRKGQGNGLLGAFSLLNLSDGETGTSLQLCYARLCSAIAKLGAPDASSSEIVAQVECAAVLESPWSDLLRLMSRYPDTTKAAFEKLEPGTILSYLFRVVEELTLCLDTADEEEADGEGSAAGSKHESQAALYEGVRQVLENGMRLLGATPINT
ncbi:Nucleotidylyl transferase [Cadophora sp. DSE1049]|nr:Nucleotidylyl transferase [Cadophora sp. DSE1049]